MKKSSNVIAQRSLLYYAIRWLHFGLELGAMMGIVMSVGWLPCLCFGVYMIVRASDRAFVGAVNDHYETPNVEEQVWS